MLKEVMKYFKPAQATNEEVTTMTEQEQATFAAAETKAAELTVALEAAATTLAEKEAAFAALNDKYVAAEAALAASADAQAMLVTQAKAAVMAARTEKLSAIMGDVQGPKTAASLEALNDDAFAVVLSSYAANFKAEAESFQEVGVAATVAPTAVAEVEESAEMKLIKAKQAAARLQTN